MSSQYSAGEQDLIDLNWMRQMEWCSGPFGKREMGGLAAATFRLPHSDWVSRWGTVGHTLFVQQVTPVEAGMSTHHNREQQECQT